MPIIPLVFGLCLRASPQGQTVGTRWQWNATVGSLLDRPGRVGDWGYVNTEYDRRLHSSYQVLIVYFAFQSGLGILEYLTFFEDVGMEPIMAVWSGMHLTERNVMFLNDSV